MWVWSARTWGASPASLWPGDAAGVVDALLDDLGATVNLHEHYHKAPKGLTELFNDEHKYGAELPCSTLFRARMTPPRTR